MSADHNASDTEQPQWFGTSTTSTDAPATPVPSQRPYAAGLGSYQEAQATRVAAQRTPIDEPTWFTGTTAGAEPHPQASAMPQWFEVPAAATVADSGQIVAASAATPLEYAIDPISAPVATAQPASALEGYDFPDSALPPGRNSTEFNSPQAAPPAAALDVAAISPQSATHVVPPQALPAAAATVIPQQYLPETSDRRIHWGFNVPRRANDALPAPEPIEHVKRLQLVAVAALVLTSMYVVWRATLTIPSTAPWFGISFVLLEVLAAIGLGLFVMTTWDVTPFQAPPPPTPFPSVTVLIATYNEDMDVLLPTVTAALDLDGPHETWVLDDGDRPHVAEMAQSLGARYVSRLEHDHAKAGNINHALQQITSELIVVLDADHVPDRDFLTATVGYFSDPKVALVQTPQDFYNTGSFEHITGELHEETLFYRVIQAGKNTLGASFWCGTNAIIRVSALRSVGGVATQTLTEDLHTTMKLHQQGWRTVYHNEVIARGLAAFGPAEFMQQRLRWGQGAMQVVRRDNPLWARGLTWRQRLSYIYSLSAWFDSWRTLAFALVPAIVLFTGLVPVQSDPQVFLPIAAVTLLMQQVALQSLSRGRSRILSALIFEFIRMPSNLLATMSLVVPNSGGFVVTAKGRTGDQRTRVPAPRLLLGLVALHLAAMMWGGLTLAGYTPLHYETLWVPVASMMWSGVTLALVGAAIYRIRHVRFGVERREGHRFTIDLPATLDGAEALIKDVSIGGAHLFAAGAPRPIGSTVSLAVDVPPGVPPVTVLGTVVSSREKAYGVSFHPHQWQPLATLTSLAFYQTALKRRAK